MDILLSIIAFNLIVAATVYDAFSRKIPALPRVPPKLVKLIIDACSILQVFALIAAFTPYRLHEDLIHRILWLLLSSVFVFGVFLFIVPTAPEPNNNRHD